MLCMLCIGTKILPTTYVALQEVVGGAREIGDRFT